MRAYFDKRKQDLFPWVEDWTHDYNEYRYADDSDVPFTKWLFFHPTPYKVVMLGMNVMAFLIFGSAATWLFFRKNYILAVIMAFIAINGVLALAKNIKNYRYIKFTTFYDLWLREY